MTMLGIDVSAFQPANISTLVPADFVIVKCTEGTDYVSSVADAQIQGALDSGKRVGFYHFIDVGGQVAQAKWFLSQTAGYFGRGVPILDWEGAGANAGPDGAWRFLSTVADATGRMPWTYMSLSLAEQAAYAGITASSLWVAYGADYGTPQGYEGAPSSSSSGVWPKAACRQFTSAGSLPGYSGRLDLDVFYGSAVDWDAAAGSSMAADAAQPKQPIEGVDDMAQKPKYARYDDQSRTGGRVWIQYDTSSGFYAEWDGDVNDAIASGLAQQEDVPKDGVEVTKSWADMVKAACQAVREGNA